MPKMNSSTYTTQPEALYQKLRSKNPHTSKAWGGILYSSDTRKCVFSAKGYTFPILGAKVELICPNRALNLSFATTVFAKKDPEGAEDIPDFIAIIAATLPTSKIPHFSIKWETENSYEFHPEDEYKLRLQIMCDAAKYNFPEGITTLQFFFYLDSLNGKEDPIFYYSHEGDPACLLLNHSFFAKEVANVYTK